MKHSRKQLLDDVLMTKPAVTKKESVRQSDCVAFDGGFVWGYNDEICVSHPTDIPITGAIRANELIKFLKKLKVKEIELDDREGAVVLSWGSRGEASFTKEPVEMPLGAVTIPEDDEFKALPRNFNESVKFAAPSAGSDSTRELLSCIHVYADRAEACDNVRMCIKYLEFPCDKMLIPAKAAKEIIKYEPIGYFVDESWISFINEQGTVICCRTFQETYPDLQAYYPKQHREVQLPDGLVEMLGQATPFASLDTEEHEVVQVVLAEGTFTVEASNSAGSFKDYLDCDYSGDEIRFYTSPKFLSKAVKLVDSMLIGDGVLAFEGEDFVHVIRQQHTGG